MLSVSAARRHHEARVHDERGHMRVAPVTSLLICLVGTAAAGQTDRAAPSALAAPSPSTAVVLTYKRDKRTKHREWRMKRHLQSQRKGGAASEPGDRDRYRNVRQGIRRRGAFDHSAPVNSDLLSFPSAIPFATALASPAAKAPIQPSLRFNHLRRRPQPKFVWELHFCPAFRRHNGSGKESAMLSSSFP